MTTTDEKTALLEYIDRLGLTYTPTFIPTPQPKEKYPKLHWSIALSKDGQVAVFPYSQGMAHIKGYKRFTVRANSKPLSCSTS